MKKRTDRRAAAPISQVRLITPKMLPEKGVPYCLNHLRRLWKKDKPEFPPPIYLSKRKIVWPEQAIDDWIAAKIGSADAQA